MNSLSLGKTIVIGTSGTSAQCSPGWRLPKAAVGDWGGPVGLQPAWGNGELFPTLRRWELPTGSDENWLCSSKPLASLLASERFKH